MTCCGRGGRQQTDRRTCVQAKYVLQCWPEVSSHNEYKKTKTTTKNTDTTSQHGFLQCHKQQSSLPDTGKRYSLQVRSLGEHNCLLIHVQWDNWGSLHGLMTKPVVYDYIHIHIYINNTNMNEHWQLSWNQDHTSVHNPAQIYIFSQYCFVRWLYCSMDDGQVHKNLSCSTLPRVVRKLKILQNHKMKSEWLYAMLAYTQEINKNKSGWGGGGEGDG